jgi:hypothetical protein
MASSSMGKIAVVGALGVGGYLLYRSMSSTTATAAAGTATTSSAFSLTDLVNAFKNAIGSSPATPAAPAAGPSSVPDSQAVQTQKLLTAANADATTLYNGSQWNYFYQQVYGVPGVGLTGDDGSPMTIATYMGLRSSNGLAGLGAVAVRKPVLVIRGAEGRPVMVLSQGRRVILGGGW